MIISTLIRTESLFAQARRQRPKFVALPLVVPILMCSACRSQSVAEEPDATQAPPPCCATDTGAIDSDSTFTASHRVVDQAESVNDVVEDAEFAGRFIPPAERRKLNLDFMVVRSDGTKFQLSEIADRPLAIAFFYTRCTNPNKCRRVASTIKALRSLLQTQRRLRDVRLLLISYDPAWDSPPVLEAYAAGLGLTLDANVMLLAPRKEDTESLFRDLSVPVSFFDEGVTVHGIQLLLVDKQGRLARTYRVVIWDNQRVSEDLGRLVDE